MKKPTLVYVDDWTILYIDGKKVLENHSIDARDILQQAEVPHEIRWLDGTDFERWLGEGNYAPDNLEDVPSLS